MGLKGCGKFLKYSMFLFNSVILVAGCGLVGFGVYTRTNLLGITRVSSILSGNLVVTLSLLLIIAGSTVILVSFLGCCGAIKEVKCMLITFFALLMLMFLGFVISGILVYVYRDKIENHILGGLKDSLVTDYGKDAQVTEAWDFMQQIFKCCGVRGGTNSTESWGYYKHYTRWYKDQTVDEDDKISFVPESCCRDHIDNDKKKYCIGRTGSRQPKTGPPVPPAQYNAELYQEGCYTALTGFLIENVRILTGLIAGIASALILGMVFAICLCKRIRDEDSYCE